MYVHIYVYHFNKLVYKLKHVYGLPLYKFNKLLNFALDIKLIKIKQSKIFWTLICFSPPQTAN